MEWTVVGLGSRTTRRAGAVGLVVMAAMLVSSLPVLAQPPTTVAGLLARYYDLSREAEKVSEQLLQVQEELAAKRQAATAAAERATEASAAAATAHDNARAARADMDRVTALLSGRHPHRGLSALVASTSPDDLLDAMEAASLAGQITGRATEYGGAALVEADRAAEAAARAREEARSAEAAVGDGAATVERQKAELDRQIAEVRGALDRLTPDQRSLLASSEFSGGDVKVPAGDVGAVLRFVLAQLGKPYVWGATGPNSYDCSGLMQTAFRVGGVAIPRVSIQQSAVGQQVLRHEVRPGDLIFYYQPVHHVAIAVDNQRAVHAPTFGETVKLSRVDAIGPITVIRRVMR